MVVAVREIHADIRCLQVLFVDIPVVIKIFTDVVFTAFVPRLFHDIHTVVTAAVKTLVSIHTDNAHQSTVRFVFRTATHGTSAGFQSALARRTIIIFQVQLLETYAEICRTTPRARIYGRNRLGIYHKGNIERRIVPILCGIHPVDFVRRRQA